MKKLTEFKDKMIDFSDLCMLRGGGRTTCTDVEETYSACGSDYSYYTEDDNGNHIETCYEGGCDGDFPVEEQCPEITQ